MGAFIWSLGTGTGWRCLPLTRLKRGGPTRTKQPLPQALHGEAASHPSHSMNPKRCLVYRAPAGQGRRDGHRQSDVRSILSEHPHPRMIEHVRCGTVVAPSSRIRAPTTGIPVVPVVEDSKDLAATPRFADAPPIGPPDFCLGDAVGHGCRRRKLPPRPSTGQSILQGLVYTISWANTQILSQMGGIWTPVPRLLNPPHHGFEVQTFTSRVPL